MEAPEFTPLVWIGITVFLPPQTGPNFAYLSVVPDEGPYVQQDLSPVCRGTAIALFISKGEVWGRSMCENCSGSTTRLERLVRQIMKEEDSLKFDELGEEIWRVLGEPERVGAMPSSPSFDLASGQIASRPRW